MISLTRRNAMLAACLLASLSALPTLGQAQQNYPAHAVKLTVGFPPGTGPDFVGRNIGQRLTETLGQSLVIENRTGAAGQIAASSVARSAADGYNLLLADVSMVSIAPFAFSKLAYKPADDFVVISEVARTDMVLVVPRNSPAKTAGDLFKTAASTGNKVNFATFGAGTPGHFGAEMLAQQGGFKIEPIHFRNTGDAVSAIVAGDVQAALITTAMASAQLKGNTMRALATTATERSPLLPGVPTFIESGYPKADFSAWFAIFAPKGTPQPILDKLNSQIVAAVKDPAVKQRMEEGGFVLSGTSQADAQRMVEQETVKWKSIVESTGFKGD